MSEGRAWSSEDTQPCSFKVVFVFSHAVCRFWISNQTTDDRCPLRGREPVASLRKAYSSLLCQLHCEIRVYFFAAE